ncbi:hypothetical protein IC620_11005 [Hazenella sp. IB182357]|uniref:Uncharacterized protein n=1 Tax=Polycladospora coralii TaxID=2771432 RepID=A0A926RUW6_9BACL|nr:hypothetical protein [Polycladospora coralii]MBD1372884.1 hypothetical protein [Polycladospora coralii]MBS7529422.1 hypothetical protein [Polycladospora coralii]
MNKKSVLENRPKQPILYSPMAMGFMHPDWIYLAHLMEEEAEENRPEPVPAKTVVEKPQHQIKINIYARK